MPKTKKAITRPSHIEISFEKLPAIEGQTACLTCGCGSHDTLPMEALLAVGFGEVTVKKNKEFVYSEVETIRKRRALWVARRAERIAAKDPNHDWRIHFFAPLYEAEYQRQGESHWVLISKGEGFA